MVAELKLVISGFDKASATLIKELNSKQTLYQSVQNFQLEANEMLTKMIEEKRLGDQSMDDDDDDDDEDKNEDEDDLEDEIIKSPKKRKKLSNLLFSFIW